MKNNKLTPHISNQLRYYRKLRGLSQVELGRRTGIDRRRISAIELRRRPCTKSEASRLAAELGFSFGYTCILSTASPKSALLPLGKAYIPKADRPFPVRLKEARSQQPALTRRLEETLNTRPDIDRVVTFLQDVPFDSHLEVLALLQLIALGLRVAYDAPGRYGYFGDKIVEPLTRANITGRRRPMIAGENFLLFPQVSFDIGRVIRVDFLVCIIIEGSPDWVVVELDGPGHKADHSRERLQHRVVRFTEWDVLSPEFATEFERRIRGRHQIAA